MRPGWRLNLQGLGGPMIQRRGPGTELQCVKGGESSAPLPVSTRGADHALEEGAAEKVDNHSDSERCPDCT